MFDYIINSKTINIFNYNISGLYLLIVFGFLLVLFFLRKYISIVLSKIFFTYLKKFSKDVPVDEFVLLIKKPFEIAFSLLLIFVFYQVLKDPLIVYYRGFENVFSILVQIYKGLLLINLCLIILRLVEFFAIVVKVRYLEESENINESSLIPFFKELIKVLVVIVFFFTFLGVVFQLNVGAIITGLGIGGLAFALAGKETLENLLASVTIFLDKPFVIGDAIKVEGIEGNVERIGFRSTRIRTFDKSLVSMPNKKMIDDTLENLTNRTLRRVRFTVGLSYGQDVNQWKEVVVRVKELLKNNLMLDGNHQVFIDEFGDYSVMLLVVYFVKTADWPIYMETKQSINFEIYHILSECGCELEYPTQKVIISKN